MGISGSRTPAVEINLDEFERRLRAAGAQSMGAEDPLSELARLVESSAPPPTRAPAAASRLVAAPAPYMEAKPPLETGSLRPALDEAEIDFDQIDDAEAVPAAEADAAPAFASAAVEAQTVRKPRAWSLRIAGLAIVGLALIGAAVYVVRHKAPTLIGLSAKPPFIAADEGPTKVQPPSEDTVSTPNDGATLLHDNAHPAPVKIVTKEEQPVDLAAQTAMDNSAPATHVEAAAGSAPDQTPPAAPGPEVVLKNTAEAPIVVPPAGAPPSLPSQFPDPKPVRTITLRPDGTPIPAPSDAPPEAANTPAPAAAPPAPEAPKAVAKAEASTPKIDLPTKLNGKSSARVAVAKTDTTGPVAGGAGEPMQLGGPAKQETAGRPKAAEKTAALDTAPAAEETAAKTGDWAVQMAAPRSEAEAKTLVGKLSEKYASALNGAVIGIHKAVVKGNAIYRLRVTGLSKSDAAKICARLKGDGGDCFIAK